MLRDDLKNRLARDASNHNHPRDPSATEKAHRTLDLMADEDLPLLLAMWQRGDQCLAHGLCFSPTDAERALLQRWKEAAEKVNQEHWNETLRDHERRQAK